MLCSIRKRSFVSENNVSVLDPKCPEKCQKVSRKGVSFVVTKILFPHFLSPENSIGENGASSFLVPEISISPFFGGTGSEQKNPEN